MTKIFTIGFSGKSPDAFIDVLDAVRVRAVWDIRLWRTSTYVPFYSGENLAATLGQRYEYHPEFAPTSEILAGYKDGRITWPDYEWMYRELYERDGGVDNIIHNLHTSPRQFYRYLDIAYMNPEKINEILSGKLKINVNNLFQIALDNQI